MDYDTSQPFPEPTPSDEYVIPKLGLNSGFFAFSNIATFLSYVTPHDLPVVFCILELLRDAIHTKVSILHLIFEALKVESGYICLIGVFLLISLIPLGYTIAWGCAKQSDDDLNPGPTVDAIIHAEELSLEDSLNCRKKFLGLFLQIIILLLFAGIIAMFVSNEQILSAIDQTPLVVRASLQDVETFLKDTQQQIIFVIFEGLNTAIDRIKDDLEDIDKLLGDPIQQELALDSGMETIFESILDIGTSSNNLARRIFLLQDTVTRAAKLAYEAQYRIDELKIQLAVLIRQCTYRDRPLCETLVLKSLEDTLFIDKIRILQSSPILMKLSSMGEAGRKTSMKNLTQELSHVRSIFRAYSTQLKTETAIKKSDILKNLETLQNSTQGTTNTLTSTTNHLLQQLNHSSNYSDSVFDQYKEAGYLMWIAGLSATLAVLFVTLILLGALSCGCCHAENHAGFTLVFGSFIICIISIVLAGFVTLEMLLGGHGEVFMCRPLYDAPNYTILGKLIDKPGLIYPTEPEFGVIGEFLTPPNYPNFDKIRVPLSTAINECELNKSTFKTFQMEKLINVSNIMDYKSFPQLDRGFDEIGASEILFIGFTNNIQEILDGMLVDSEFNLTVYRNDLGQLSPENDMMTFIDQMDRVKNQIQDSATTSRMRTLGGRAKRLQISILQSLETLKNDIVYHLTALELQITPWTNQVNKSLNHLRNSQAFLDIESEEVCRNKSEAFRQRLKMHLDSYRNHTLTILNENCATCRPLYEIFDAIRMLFCGHIMDPMNGLWFSTFFCLFLWSIATPLALMMSSTYRRLDTISSKLQHTNSHRYGVPREETLTIREQSNWSSRSQLGTTIGHHTHTVVPDIDRSNW